VAQGLKNLEHLKEVNLRENFMEEDDQLGIKRSLAGRSVKVIF